MKRFLVAAMIAGAAGCDLVPSQASCDFRPAQPRCSDLLTNRNNQLSATLRALCVGNYSDNLCNHTGALGGCECDGCENGKAVDWYFPDTDGGITTAADVMKECAKEGHPFVTP